MLETSGTPHLNFGTAPGNRFKKLALLTSSNQIETYLGKDTVTQMEVVIKCALNSNQSSVAYQRLYREAEILKKLESTYVPQYIYDGFQANEFLLVSTRQPGESLKHFQQRHSFTPTFAIDLGLSLFSALKDIHGQNVIHNDIKPENILINSIHPKVEVVVVDFGFSKTNFHGVYQGEWAGTANYIAPEQSGLLSGQSDERSDLYSAGIVLFECLSGQLPFNGTTLNEILRLHLNAPVPNLSTLCPSIPRALSDIIMHLLQKEPNDRYQSAAAVIHDLQLLKSNLGSGNPSSLIVGLEDARRGLTNPAFIGRESEILDLKEVVRATQIGRGGIYFIEATSGGGKTRLLNEFSNQLAPESLHIFWGQGVDQTAQRPFHILVGVAMGILAKAKFDAEFRFKLEELLKSERDALLGALPELREIINGDSSEAIVQELFGEERNLRALATLIGALGQTNKPSLIIIDDCQWADEVTLKLLNKLNRQWQYLEGQSNYVSLIVSFRSDEVDSHHPLRTIKPRRHFSLPPLNKIHLKQLLNSMAGSVSEEIVKMVTELSQGSPFMVTAVMHGLQESGSMICINNRWQLATDSSSLQSSQKAAIFLIRRFKVLPAPLLRLLKLASVLGKDFDLNLLVTLSEESKESVLAQLAEAQKRQIIWRKGPGSFGFVHDKLREALLELLDSSERQRTHCRAAETIKTSAPAPMMSYDIAYHFDAAGLPERAFPYAISAAEEARKRHSLQQAEQQYRIALKAAVSLNTEMLERMEEGLGDILMLRGKYGEAAKRFETARKLADNDLSRSQLDAKLGELFFKQGEMASASRALKQGLNLLGRRVPQNNIIFFICCVWELIIQLLHTFTPSLILKRKLAPNETQLLVFRLYSRLAYCFWFERGRIPCAWSHLRGMNLAETYPPSLALAQAYSEHAPVMTMVPLFARGIKYVTKSLSLRKSFGDLWGQGQSLNFYGVVLYGASRYNDCIQKCTEAVAILEKTGDRWESNTARWHIAYCHYRLGNLEQAINLSQIVYSQAIEIGDDTSASIALSVWAKASGGRLPHEHIEKALEKQCDDVHSRSELLQALGIWQFDQGKLEESIQTFKEAQTLIETKGFSQEYVAPILPWLTTTLRVLIEKSSPFMPTQKNKLLKEAWRTARRSYRNSKKYRNNLPHALRELGYLSALSGRPQKALAYFDRSLSVSRAQSAEYESERTLLAKARLSCEIQNNSRITEIDGAIQLLQRRKANLTMDNVSATENHSKDFSLSLVDRFESLLKIGRKIATSQDKEGVYRSILEAANYLLRSEHCFIADPKLPNKPLFGESGTPLGEIFSERLLKLAIEQGHPVSYAEEPSVAPNESMILTGIRSALCAPIYVHGSCVLYLFVTHKHIPGLFGEKEEQLAAFIAALAGAALENISILESSHAQTERLIESNSELERFAFITSHDLKEPLRMISQSTEILNELEIGEIKPEAKQFMSFLLLGTERMQNMIDDILVYSRIGAMESRFENISSHCALLSAKENLRAALQDSNAKIVYGELPIVRGLLPQLTQVFQNLIGNAIKFRGPSTPQISIEAKPQEGEWIFSIRDNGIGFDPKYAQQIFSLFKKLHSKDEYPGTGIGLATCKKIIERHGGRIWAESELGKGSVFYFTLKAHATPQ